MICKNCGREITSEKIWFLHIEKCRLRPEPEPEQDVPGKGIDEMTYQELRALAKEREIEGFHKMDTEELREALLQTEEGE